jgi:fructan beta-fructosidase
MFQVSWRARRVAIGSVLAGLLLVPALLNAEDQTTPPQKEETRSIAIQHRYLNVPIGRGTKMRIFHISTGGAEKREFAMQLAEGAVDYWIYIDVSEFKGQAITLAGPATQPALGRIYQADTLAGAASLYKEAGRPLFHFTVKRGWNNDVNGPIFYKGQYHLFWQAFPFGVQWDTDFMYWGHAVSKDLIHWRELPPALMADKLGAAWSGSSFVDRANVGSWGKDALVLVYTAFDRVTHRQRQCIAYSTDNGATFMHFAGDPVLDTDAEVGSVDTRDPHVFWYEPGKHWVMVLFEKDGMSIFNSTDLKAWTRQSHFKGLYECPDLFELPVDGDARKTKWVLHGGSATYYIGSFDGKTFTAESGELHYAEGKNVHGDDVLYASQSFADMPDGRRVQMAWGRITEQGMPFNQMLLFPTEFKLATTKDGLRMITSPIAEVERLHGEAHSWAAISVAEANKSLAAMGAKPVDVRLKMTLADGDALKLSWQGKTLATIAAAELAGGKGQIDVLIDKGVAETFVAGTPHYELADLSQAAGDTGLELSVSKAASKIDGLKVFAMKSMWNGR